jgi:two-component system CitB family sensor kinase
MKPRAAPRRRGSFRWRLFAGMVGIILLLSVITGGAHAWRLSDQIQRNTQQKSLTLARTLASDPSLRDRVARIAAGPSPTRADAADPLIQQAAEDIRRRTGALFVVVTDEVGIRLSHPDPTRIGQRVSTDPTKVLAGHEEVTGNSGTLGPSAGAKVPIYSRSGAVVGEVSVGFENDSLRVQWLEDAQGGLIITAVAVLLCFGVAGALSRRLHQQILGLEPSEIAAMATEQEAVLHAVDEGVVGIDPTSVVTVANPAALSMLPGLAVGQRVEDSPIPQELSALVRGQGGIRTVVVGSRVLVCTARRVRRDSHDIGVALVLRDRTQVQSLSQELADARAVTDALRIQRHEFSNQLHALAGLLESGSHADAAEYLHSLTAARHTSGVEGLGRLSDDGLAIFLTAKGSQAHERSIRLMISDSSLLTTPLSIPDGFQDVTTVLGNLLDNAFTAAVANENRAPAVLLDILEHEDTLHIAVTDTGPGIGTPPSGVVDDIFSHGYSTLPSLRGDEGGHGIGLALIRRIARARGGDVWVGSSHGDPEWPGATLCARLPRVFTDRPERNA